MQIIAGLAPLKQIREVPSCLSITLLMMAHLKARAAHRTGIYANRRSLESVWFGIIGGDGWSCHMTKIEVQEGGCTVLLW